MPTYEYIAVDESQSCNQCCNVFELQQSIKEDALTHCQSCSSPIRRIISVGYFIMKGKMANQYNDILAAKYWVDHNGNKHRVTPGDGHSNAPTVSRKQTRSPEERPEEIAARKRAERKAKSKKRSADSYRKYVETVKKLKRQ